MSVYVICEIGINGNGSMDLTRQLIDAAVDAGANAVKFQRRTVEAVYTVEELAKPRESPFGTTNGELKHALEYSPQDYEDINAYCKSKSIDWSASCWDSASVGFIAQFSPPWLKIPSALITNEMLVDAYRATHIPLIVSTGMSSWEEIDQVVEWVSGGQSLRHTMGFWADRTKQITLLHCHSSYPSPLDELNLACIQSLKARYGLPVGYSSHTVSPWPCLMAAVYGAEVIEFHLTLDRSMWGTDQSASLEPAAAKKLVEEIRTWERCKGDGVKRVYPSEIPIKAKLRR